MKKSSRLQKFYLNNELFIKIFITLFCWGAALPIVIVSIFLIIPVVSWVILLLMNGYWIIGEKIGYTTPVMGSIISFPFFIIGVGSLRTDFLYAIPVSILAVFLVFFHISKEWTS